MNLRLPNGTNEDPFVDLYVPKGSEAPTRGLPGGTHDHNTAFMLPAASKVPIAFTPPKAEVWWQDPAKWLQILTPLVVVVWCFYLGLYFASPSSVPNTLVPPGIRQEAQAAPKKTADTPQPVHQNPSTQKTADTPALDFNTNEPEKPETIPSASISTTPSVSTSPQTSTSATPKVTAETSSSPQQPAPTKEPSQAPSEVPVIPSTAPSVTPSPGVTEEQVSSGDPAAAPSE